MPKYSIVLDGQEVDKMETPKPVPSSALIDYATNNHHIKTKLGNRHVTKVEIGDFVSGQATKVVVTADVLEDGVTGNPAPQQVNLQALAAQNAVKAKAEENKAQGAVSPPRPPEIRVPAVNAPKAEVS